MALRTRDRLQSALAPRFRITRELGGGGMSETFVAHDEALDREIVIKVLAPALADQVNLERFSREIRLSATLQHPNLVPVLDSGVADGLPYYTMPFVSGDSLRRRLDGTPMAVDAAIVVLRDVARGLGAAHERGVVHRDIKPDNVLLSGNAAIVTDLGIAKALATSGSSTALTRTGVAMGTPAYFAPEQATGEEIDARADWYAFGVMAYEMLTGQLPFSAPTDAGMLVAHVTATPVDIRTIRPQLPAPLASLVMQCLAKDPAARPATAVDVVRTLDAASSSSAGAVLELPRGKPVERATRIVRRLSYRAILSMLAVPALVAVGVGLWRRRDVAAPPQAVRGVRTVWIATNAGGALTAQPSQRDIARTLRSRIPDAAGVTVAERDTLLADSSAAAAFARDGRVVVVWLFSADRQPTRATIYTPATGAACDVFTNSADATRELTERILGVLATRYDAVLAQRYMRGARLMDRESICSAYRLDALQRLAAFRADSTRPMSRRLADLDTALLLDPGFLEARLDRARATGDTATVRTLERGTEMNASNRLEIEVARTMSTDPLGALQLAEQGAETGQIAALTLARVALNVAHARTALAALAPLTASDVADDGGATMLAAMRAEAYFQLGEDARVLTLTAPAPGVDASVIAMVRLPSLAARRDSAAWLQTFREAKFAPALRVLTLARCAAVARVAGHRGLSDVLYRMARDEGDVLLQRPGSTASFALLVAEVRRRTGDVSGARTILDRIRGSGDSLQAAIAEQLRLVIALESGDERTAREAQAALDRRRAKIPGALSALLSARVESVRGNIPRATELLQQALALGLSRQFEDPTTNPIDLRGEVDLMAVYATASGKSLALATQ